MVDPATPTTGVTAPKTTGFDSNKAALSGAASGQYFMPTTTNTSYLTQTSPQDISSIINAAMQQLTGRFATANEIRTYGAELLSAQRANQGSYSGTTDYASSGKRSTVTGQQISTGVDAQSFIANLINGTGEARTYKAASGYFDAMEQSNNKFRSAFSG